MSGNNNSSSNNNSNNSNNNNNNSNNKSGNDGSTGGVGLRRASVSSVTSHQSEKTMTEPLGCPIKVQSAPGIKMLTQVIHKNKFLHYVFHLFEVYSYLAYQTQKLWHCLYVCLCFSLYFVLFGFVRFTIIFFYRHFYEK